MRQQHSRKFGVTIAIASLILVGGVAGCDLLPAIDSSTANSEAVSYEKQVAVHLRQTNAKMYGAYWCPHCAEQKALFGAAVKDLPYVECDPQGENAQPDLCAAKQIRGYPTWEIDGKLYPGVRSPLELATLSHYKTAKDAGASEPQPQP